MSEDCRSLSEAARRWLRALRIVRRRVQGAVQPPSRFLLVVTPLDEASDMPLHVESGSDRWGLLDRGGDVVVRLGVPCLVTVHDLDEADIELGEVAWLPVGADGLVTTLPRWGIEMSDTHEPTDAEALFEQHKLTGEPLDESQIAAIVGAGLASEDEFAMRGGGLYFHHPTFPDTE
jgi:hypothetical protein